MAKGVIQQARLPATAYLQSGLAWMLQEMGRDYGTT